MAKPQAPMAKPQSMYPPGPNKNKSEPEVKVPVPAYSYPESESDSADYDQTLDPEESDNEDQAEDDLLSQIQDWCNVPSGISKESQAMALQLQKDRERLDRNSGKKPQKDLSIDMYKAS